MGTTPRPLTRGLTVIAQDPSITDAGGKILRAVLQVPAEPLAPGPCGHRVQVVDYDASTDVLYRPQKFEPEGSDPFAKASDAKLLGSPGFHAQNVYAIVMCTLSRFEYALGRRVPFEPELDADFRKLLDRHGLPGEARIRAGVEAAVASGTRPDAFAWPTTRRGRAVARLTLRRIAQRSPGDLVAAWRAHHDHAEEE